MQWKMTDGTRESLPKRDCNMLVITNEPGNSTSSIGEVYFECGTYDAREAIFIYNIYDSRHDEICLVDNITKNLLMPGIYYLKLPKFIKR
jgi:hypothetical protein